MLNLIIFVQLDQGQRLLSTVVDTGGNGDFSVSHKRSRPVSDSLALTSGTRSQISSRKFRTMISAPTGYVSHIDLDNEHELAVTPDPFDVESNFGSLPVRSILY